VRPSVVERIAGAAVFVAAAVALYFVFVWRLPS
jgi:hypothetical protein